MKTVRFRILRYNPDSDSLRPSTYDVPARMGMTLLDALNYIFDNLDGTLAYRYSCRMGICGSCAISVNGKPMLACYTQVLDLGEEVVLEPLPNLQPIKDLVVDLSDFMNKFRVLKPYLLRAEPPPFDRELVQSISEQRKVWDYSLCTKCAACLGACPACTDENFPGPTHLSMLYRFMVDSRDQGLEERLNVYRDGIWLCTSCSSCDLVCPKEIKSSELVIETRKLMTDRGFPPKLAKDALFSLLDKHNPWGFPSGDRNEFLRGAGVRFLEEGAETGTLLFACCTSTFDLRCVEAAKALVQVLGHGGVDMITLGSDEWCCGDSALRLGETGLYGYLVEHNCSSFKKFDIKEIVTPSPHCYNTFKNEKMYSELGLNFEHHTQLLTKLIENGKLKFTKNLKARVTYHDPCFLGKYNKIYEEPRKILESIPGLELIEMKRKRENSFCCGGGGGRPWSEESVPHGEKPQMYRAREAVELDVDFMVTSCPFCLMMLSDAVKTLGLEEKLKVCDISALAAKTLCV